MQSLFKLDRAKLSSVLPKFEQYAEKTRKDWKVPGMAVAIVVNDEMVYAKGFGVKQVGGTDAIAPPSYHFLDWLHV